MERTVLNTDRANFGCGFFTAYKACDHWINQNEMQEWDILV